MSSASLKIEFGGKKAADCIRVLDKHVAYKRSKVEYKSGRGTIEIRVTASDSVALVSALNGALKQLRIITSVDRAVSRLVRRAGPAQ